MPAIRVVLFLALMLMRGENAQDNAKGMVVDWQHDWAEFDTPKFDDLMIYQAHVGSFAGLNDHRNIPTYATFTDFQTKLGYIRALGFNALQLLPIAQVDGVDNEGYGARYTKLNMAIDCELLTDR